jgi:hypothetical protein
LARPLRLGEDWGEDRRKEFARRLSRAWRDRAPTVA